VINYNNEHKENIVEQPKSGYSLTYGDEKTSHLGLDDIYLEIEERILEAIKVGEPFIFEGANERGNLYYSIERRAVDYLLSVKEITEDTADLIQSTLDRVKKLGKDNMEEIMALMMFEDIDIDIKKTMILPLTASYEALIEKLQELRTDANEILVDNLIRLKEIVTEYEEDVF